MTRAAASKTCITTELASLVDMIGLADMPLVLARLLHESFASNHVFIIRAGRYERDLIQSASFDGSDSAARLHRMFFDRRMERFEQNLLTRNSDKAADFVVEPDHTQEFASPEFRSFGRETGIGARVIIRRSEARGSVAIAMLWSIRHGNISPMLQNMREAAGLIAPIVAKHMSICDERAGLRDRLSSIVDVEESLKRDLGDARRREAQVGARIIAGMSTSEIADDLMISRETVISHRRALYGRLDLQTNRDLLIRYLEANR